MNQDFRGASIRTGRGGAGGGRGGDVGSHNYSKTSHSASHNDSSVRQRINGDNYMGSVDQGDTFNGYITNSTVGGRGNSNHITNNNTSRLDTHNLSEREIELNERLKMAREKLAAKRAERQRLQKMEDELKELEAQIGED